MADAQNEPSSLRLAGTLAVAGLMSGLILVGVFLATEPIIRQNHADALQRAIYKVLPGTKKIEAFKLSGDDVVPYEGIRKHWLFRPDDLAIWACPKPTYRLF